MSQPEIEGETVLLRPIARAVAAALLDGHLPAGMHFADGYPSQFSLEVMDLLAGPRAVEVGPDFHSWFVVRREDEAIVGEMGYGFDAETSTATVGYSIVEPSWGRGYATAGLRALVTHLRSEPRVQRVLANTLADHSASRKVMEKAGMRFANERLGEEGGELVELVVYEMAVA